MLRPRFRHNLPLLLCAGMTVTGCQRAPLSVDDIINRNSEAVGGRAAIEAVNSIEVGLHVADPDFEVDGVYRAERPGRMRIDIMAGEKHVYTEAFNGRRGWQWKGSGDPVEESPSATAALRHGVELPGKIFGLHELRQRGDRIDLGKSDKVDGIEYHVLNVTLADGYKTSLYIDPKSWLITRRRDIRPLHVDIDPTPTTIEYGTSDFRKISNVIFAFAGADTDLSSGKILERTNVRTIKVNPAFDRSIFDKL